MQHSTLACALLTSALALSAPSQGGSVTLTAAYLTADEVALLSSDIDPDTLARREAFLTNYSVLDINIDGHRTGIRLENNARADKVFWINGSIDLSVVLCDGSVLVAIPGVACDGSVMPVADMVLSVASTFNPSVWMGLTYTTANTGEGSNVGVAVISGINPFEAGSQLQGTIDAELGLVVRNADIELSLDAIEEQFPEADLGVQIRRRSDIAELGSYTGGLVDGITVYRAGTDTDGLGDPIGIHETRLIDTTLTPGLFTCDFCANAGVLMAFQMAPSPAAGLLSQARGNVTFTYTLAPPPPAIALPAAGWLLLGGLGTLWLVPRRRARTA